MGDIPLRTLDFITCVSTRLRIPVSSLFWIFSHLNFSILADIQVVFKNFTAFGANVTHATPGCSNSVSLRRIKPIPPSNFCSGVWSRSFWARWWWATWISKTSLTVLWVLHTITVLRLRFDVKKYHLPFSITIKSRITKILLPSRKDIFKRFRILLFIHLFFRQHS